jgi:ABC-2 type transport system permease protein
MTAAPTAPQQLHAPGQNRPRLRAVAAAASLAVMADRSGLMITGAFYLMVTSVLGGLWMVAADANQGSIVGYTATALVWYIATSETSTTSLPLRLIEGFGNDLQTGRLETELLRPTSVLSVRMANEIGAMVPRLVLCCGLGIGFASLVGGRPPDAGALALAGPALVLAVTINLVSQHVFAAAAFWLREAKSAWFLYQKLVFMLGGMLLPLEVLPLWLERAAKWSPFAAMSYVPARLASGHFEPGWIAVQFLWLGVVSLGARWVFAVGERRLVRGDL